MNEQSVLISIPCNLNILFTVAYCTHVLLYISDAFTILFDGFGVTLDLQYSDLVETKLDLGCVLILGG